MPTLATVTRRSIFVSLLLIAGSSVFAERPLQDYGRLPLAFEPNLGQTDRRVAFLARGSGFQLFITPDAAVLRFPGQVLRMELVGANRNPHLSGADPLPGQSHYLTGQASIRHVPHFGRTQVRGIYQGIDLSYYGKGSQLEYDFVVAPGADPRLIAIDIHGARELTVGNQGELRIHTEAGEVVWNAPVAYQEDRNVTAEYVLRGKKRVGFRVAAYDRSRPLVIDPVLAWSTLLGGTGHDHAYAVAVDGTESAVITGDAGSSDFPTTAGAYKRTDGGVFVSKLNAAGSALVYSTFLGPGRGNSIALQGGNAYVTGRTTNTFPTTTGAYNDSAPGNNVFITKLKSDGSDLVYSALLGQGLSEGWGIAVDGSGNAYVTGRTTVKRGKPPLWWDSIESGSSCRTPKRSAELAQESRGSDSANWRAGVVADVAGDDPLSSTSSCGRNLHCVLEVAHGEPRGVTKILRAGGGYLDKLDQFLQESARIRLLPRADHVVEVRQGVPGDKSVKRIFLAEP